jgi:undecaprenyl pyrophosphate phosphatase UppP
MLAVLVEYRRRFLRLATSGPRRLCGCAGCAGCSDDSARRRVRVLFHAAIKARLFFAATIAVALGVGGAAMIARSAGCRRTTKAA